MQHSHSSEVSFPYLPNFSVKALTLGLLEVLEFPEFPELGLGLELELEFKFDLLELELELELELWLSELDLDLSFLLPEFPELRDILFFCIQ